MTFRFQCEKLARWLAFDYIFLLTLLIVSFLPYCIATSHPVHDTMNILQTFQFFYNEYLVNNQLPLWNPYVLFGTPNFFRNITDISPSMYFVAFVGKILNVTDVLFLFKVSMFIEQLFFLTGVYLLAKKVFRHTAAVLFVGIGAVFTVFWIMQLQLNFHSYYLLPFILLFMVRFSETADVNNLWLAWLAFLLSRIGTSIYLAPVTILLVLVFFFTLYAIRGVSNTKTRIPTPWLNEAPERNLIGYYLLPIIFLPGALVLIISPLSTKTDQLVARFLELLSYRDIPLYLAPFQISTFVILCVLTLRQMKCDNVIDYRAIFSRRSLLLLGMCLFTSGIYLDYVSHCFMEMQMYAVQRTSLGWNDLNNFLLYGGHSGPKKLWGYIYPEQVNSDITFYIGLIPLVFALFAILNPVRHRYFLPFAVAGSVLICLAHSYYTLVAPLSYLFVPAMSYYRHLAWLMSGTKIFLLMASGFGIDAYVGSGSHSTGRIKATRLLIFIATSLLGIILFFDLVVFHFGAPYVSTGIDLSPLDKIIHKVHYVALFTLAAFIAGLTLSLRGWLPASKLTAVILGLYLVNISAYHLTMAFYTPGVEAGNPSVVLNMPEASGGKEKRFREAFLADRYVFQNERVNEDRFHEINPYIGDILGFRGEKYSYLYSAFHVDPCRPVVYRADFLPLPVDRLLRARLGLQIDVPVDHLGVSVHWQDMLKTLSTDEALLKSMGCDSPKVRVVSDAYVAANLLDAAEYLRQTHDIDRVPVILYSVSPKSARKNYREKVPSSLEPYSNSEIMMWHFTANSLNLAAKVPAKAEEAWLVYLDSYHSGWKAWVNGRPTEVSVANLAFKAVPLDPGENQVRFLFTGYGERTTIFGIIIFAFGVIGVLALLWFVGCSVVPSVVKRNY